VPVSDLRAWDTIPAGIALVDLIQQIYGRGIGVDDAVLVDGAGREGGRESFTVASGRRILEVSCHPAGEFAVPSRECRERPSSSRQMAPRLQPSILSDLQGNLSRMKVVPEKTNDNPSDCRTNPVMPSCERTGRHR
jgi:hypothetical protein